MEHQELFVEVLSGLLVFFAVSGLVIPLLRRMEMSPVLGYLLAGVVIGPNGLALLADQFPALKHITIQNTTSAQTLGELGIIALLFMIGLELSLQRLRELKHYVLGLGSLQILVCGAVIAGIASMFDNSIEASLLLGASLALSSTAIVMQLLSERHLINRPVGILSRCPDSDHGQRLRRRQRQKPRRDDHRLARAGRRNHYHHVFPRQTPAAPADEQPAVRQKPGHPHRLQPVSGHCLFADHP
jgi:hypothetical protein